MPRWDVLARRSLYTSRWVDLELASVRLPDGSVIDHHVVTIPEPAVAVVVRNRGRVLAIHRHSFITDAAGWEMPAGRMEPGELPEAAALRECVEETGWRPLRPRLAVSGHPAPGLIGLLHHVVVCEGADHVGDPVDTHEADRVEWVPESDLLDLIGRGEMPDGYSQYAVLAALAGL